MNYFLIIFLVLFCVCYFKFNKKSEKFRNEKVVELRPILQPVKKISPPIQHKRIFGRPNKCFSCEREIMKKTGGKNIHLAFPSKCFDCEKESKNPYMTGPTKCFSCD